MRWNRRITTGGILVVAASAGALAWGLRDDGPEAPEPLRVACREGSQPVDEGGGDAAPVLRRAPQAASSAPVAGRPEPWQPVDYIPLSDRNDPRPSGYRVDTATGAIGFPSAVGPGDSSPWLSTVSDRPLQSAKVSAGPWGEGLALVTGLQRDGSTSVLAVVHRDGDVRLHCEVAGTPGSGKSLTPHLSPDASVLLAVNRAEDGASWLEAHDTADGSHLWSVPGSAFAVSDTRLFVGEGAEVTAYELSSGKEAWASRPDTGEDPEAGGSDEAWQMWAAGEEVYVFREGGERLLALAADEGQVNWDTDITGPLTGADVQPLTDDGETVLLRMGADYAVRRPGDDRPTWIHRSLKGTQLEDVLARHGDTTLVTVTGSDPNQDMVTVYTDSGNELFQRPFKHGAAAVADTVVYVLEGRTVTAYELDSSSRLWSVPVPRRPGGDAPRGIQAYDGGFRLLYGPGKPTVPFTAGD